MVLFGKKSQDYFGARTPFLRGKRRAGRGFITQMASASLGDGEAPGEVA